MGRGERTAAALWIAVSILTSPIAAGETAGPTLTAVRETALVDEPVRITVTGCEAGQRVVLRAVSFDDDDMRWESRATFKADADGRVDPGTTAPIQGTYEGVHRMGLFWSMRNDEWPRAGFASHELDPLEVVLQLEIDGEVRKSRRLIRQRILPSVTRRDVRERGLVGTLFLPEAEGSVGAIVVLGGSSGGLSEGTAALLASHGFATLALAYHGGKSLPENLAEIPLEYFETAIQLLGEQEAIDSDRIGLWGASRGGELALLLGATFPRVRAVVAAAPSGVVWTGCCSPEAFQLPAWTHGGDPITPLRSDESDPDVQAHDAEVAKKMRAGEPVAHAPRFRLAVEKATNLKAATIPVERTRGPILLLSGEADGLWPSTELAEIAMRRLRQSEFPFQFEHRSYEDAGHVFEHPFLPNPTISRQGFVFGGTPAGNAKAAADAWSRTLTFYEEALGRSEASLQAGSGAESRRPGVASPPPIVDMHLHARDAPDPSRELPPRLCLPVTVYGVTDPQCADPLVAPAIDEQMVARTREILDRRNVYGVLSGDSLVTVRRYCEAAPGRLIPSYELDLDGDDLPPEDLRDHFTAGDFAVLGEVAPQYHGIAPDDPRLAP